MFLELIFSDQKAINHGYFCYAFKDLDGQPTNLFEQKDCSQFLSFLLERIETNLKETDDKELVSSHFEGKTCHEIIS